MKRHRLSTGVGAILLAGAAWIPSLQSATQQRDPRAAPPTPNAAALTGTGALGGVVTNADGSSPVKFASVVLVGPGTGVARVSSTDADGKFLFTNLPADRYTVGASKPPYLGTVAGARRPARPGTPIVLAEAQKITNIAIRMPMGAVITGTVLNEKGQPVSNVRIGVYQWRMQAGERVAVSVSSSNETDDRGRYRVFGLTPGEYLVAAFSYSSSSSPYAFSVAEVDAALRAGTSAPLPATLPGPLATQIYFPNTTRASDAAPVALSAGEERGGIDFKLAPGSAVRVSGFVTFSDGVMPPRVAVSLATKGPSILQSVMNVSTQPDGTFVIANVPPGTYSLKANAGQGVGGAQIAGITIEVGATDLVGQQLMLRPALAMSGSIVFRGTAAPPAFAGLRLAMRALGAGNTAPTVPAMTDAGTFTIANILAGSYVFGGSLTTGPSGDTIPWALDSVVIDGKDVTDLPVEVTTDNPPKNVVVTFTDRFQELSGLIRRADGAPAPEHTIVVFPEDKTYWVFGSRRILAVRPATDGRFIFSGSGPISLPPGKYLIAAVTDLERDEQFDPAFLAALVPGAVPISLLAGEKKVQDLVVK